MKAFRTVVVLLLAASLPASLHASAADKDKWCSRRHARGVIHDFIAAYNKGDFRTLDHLFAKEPDFVFYRLFPERQGPASEDRSGLIAYFRERHELEDSFEMTEFP